MTSEQDAENHTWGAGNNWIPVEEEEEENNGYYYGYPSSDIADENSSLPELWNPNHLFPAPSSSPPLEENINEMTIKSTTASLTSHINIIKPLENNTNNNNIITDINHHTTSPNFNNNIGASNNIATLNLSGNFEQMSISNNNSKVQQQIHQQQQLNSPDMQVDDPQSLETGQEGITQEEKIKSLLLSYWIWSALLLPQI